MQKYYIPIILGTTRKENESQKVANYLEAKLSQISGVEAPIFDLGKADFPLLVDRVTPDNSITPALEEWTKQLSGANAIVIVAPEYKSGYPGSLKNFLDYLPAGVFRYKPIGISTVSSGIYGGTSCLQQLRQVIIAMAGLVIPDRFQIGLVGSAFDLDGNLTSEKTQKIGNKFISELLKYTKALEQTQIGE